MPDWTQTPHRRRNALTGEWVLVSPQRTMRPWQGQVEGTGALDLPQYDPDCYLCPGNERAGGVRNPHYSSSFAFDNDFPALLPSTPSFLQSDPLLTAAAERGVCRVVCFSPRHDLSLPSMELDDLNTVVQTWCEQYVELRALPFIQNVQIFENRGAMMGASNPHPHCQIWASASVPDEIRREGKHQQEYLATHDSCLLCDYLAKERNGYRAVLENESFAAFVPFWAIWPFETLVIAKRHLASMDELTPVERSDLGAILRDVTQCYDRLFGVPFPYSMGFHQQPNAARSEANRGDAWHFHAHFYPPLLRSATVRKFMVGFELLAGPQRDITPEEAAAHLRNQRDALGQVQR